MLPCDAGKKTQEAGCTSWTQYPGPTPWLDGTGRRKRKKKERMDEMEKTNKIEGFSFTYI